MASASANTGNGPSAPAVYEMHIFHAAQEGNVQRIHELISKGEATATDVDTIGVTPLHWTAINNRVEAALYLINHGAAEHVNARGGELNATPLLWACRQGCLQMVTVLIKHGADPTMADEQGFNALHVAAQFGHAFVVLYLLLATNIDVDAIDPDNRTALMWSAYKGNSYEVIDILVHFGADLDRADKLMCTALHWAVLKENREAAGVLIRAGASLDKRDEKGKTPVDLVKEKPWEVWWDHVSKEWGMHSSDRQILAKSGWDNMESRNRIMYLIPFGMILISLVVLCTIPWFLAIAVIIALIYGFVEGASRYIMALNMLPKSPFLTAIFQASVVYCQITYLFVILPGTISHVWLHLAYVSSSILFAFYFVKCAYGDPGVIKAAITREGKQEVVLELAELGILDSKHFCVTCNVRKPIRSKHCKQCNVCVAKFDHHCPYTHSCIGAGNHRDFMFFLYTLVPAKILFVILACYYLSELHVVAGSNVEISNYCFIGESLCTFIALDVWTVIVLCWTAMNCTWVVALTLIQTYQIAVARTTNEGLNYDRYSYLRKSNLGNGQEGNPFDHGILRNLTDFFTNGAGVNRDVNWKAIYNIPNQGYTKLDMV